MSTQAMLSLEDHLADALRPLVELLPDDLATELKHVLASSPPPRLPEAENPTLSSKSCSPTIPYALLTAISKWSRTSAAERALSSHAPPLRVQDYSLVSLLAGTRTDPNRIFPQVPSSTTHDFPAARTREITDRRAVTALANALLSVFGAALATWWAAERLHWKDEWRVLLALSVAIVVASSEGILYVIWHNRRSKPASRRGPRHLQQPLRGAPVSDPSQPQNKKFDSDPSFAIHADARGPVVLTATSTDLSGTQDSLRERTAAILAIDRRTRQNR